jgi:hypothetical protein
MGSGKVCHQPIAGKAMGLPGGRGSPIERRDRDGGQAAWVSPSFVGSNPVVSLAGRVGWQWTAGVAESG